MAKITERHIKAWEKFNDELEAYRNDHSDDFAHLYEDAYTTRDVRNFKMTKTGILTWEENWQTFKGWSVVYELRKEREVMMDEDDAREWLKWWRACLRKAKKYDAMDIERLDAIQDGRAEDIEDEE